ncbi:hypothetical protein EON78_05465 [bacterium]|nr:MAG: hypothetical protein EON78_05465 [bacterium]
MKEVVKNDFKMHADLTKVFPNTEEGAQKFLGTLQKLPGNSAGKPTITDAKDLLNFINTGSDGKGEGPSVGNNPGKIQRLQVLLEKCCGTMGEEIRGKNTPKGGDDHYGYATTLQIRALSGAINNEAKINTPTQIESKGDGQILDKDFTKLIPENKQVMIAMDVSGSMNGNDRSTLTKYSDVINDNPSSDLGFMVFNSNSGANDSGGSVLFKPGKGNESISQEQKKVNTNKDKLDDANANVNNAQKKFDDLNARYTSMKTGPEKTKVFEEKNEARTELNNAKFKLSSIKNELNQANNELKTKQKNLVSQSIGSAGGTHAESGSKAALKALEQMDPKGKEPYVIVQTDEPDKSLDSMKDLVKQGLSKKVDPKSVVFFNPDTKETVSLQEIIIE